jgi:GNAT superfamily N-acetyltransferase
MAEITVSLASDQEARACLALLGEVRGAPVELLIARRRGALAGAAAVSWQSWLTPAGFPTTIEVVPDARRLGVGRRLLEAAADLAAEETDGLWTFGPVADDGDAAKFMAACGFSRLRRQLFFQAPIESLLGNITPLLNRLRRRTGAGPPPRIVDLALAQADQVARLVAREIGGPQPTPEARAAHRMRREGAGRDRSQAAVVGDAVAGVILWEIAADGVAVVEARVVGPPWRGGPVNLMLLEAGLLRGQAEGLSEVRFHCDESVKDTLALARRARAAEVATKGAPGIARSTAHDGAPQAALSRPARAAAAMTGGAPRFSAISAARAASPVRAVRA